jgi:hypothetical protein
MASNCIVPREDGRGVPGWSCSQTASGRCGAPAAHGAAAPLGLSLLPWPPGTSVGAAANRPPGTGPPLPSKWEGVIDRVGMETCDGPGLRADPTLEWAARFKPSAQPLHGEGVTDHADATSTLGGHLALAQVPVVRPVLGGGMRPAHRPALALGALHLRAHAHGYRHHRQGARAHR